MPLEDFIISVYCCVEGIYWEIAKLPEARKPALAYRSRSNAQSPTVGIGLLGANLCLKVFFIFMVSYTIFGF